MDISYIFQRISVKAQILNQNYVMNTQLEKIINTTKVKYTPIYYTYQII